MRTGHGRPRRVRLAYTATRERILDAAAEVFQHGYHESPLDAVAQRLGVTKPAIYHYFPSKEDLLAELYDRLVTLALARMEAIHTATMAPAAKLEAMLRTHVGLVIEELPLFTIFFREEKNLPASFRNTVLPKQRRYGRMLVDVYRQGVREGVFRDLDPVAVASALLAMGNWLYHWYRPEGRLSAKAITDITVSLALTGCLAPNDSRQPRGERARTRGTR